MKTAFRWFCAILCCWAASSSLVAGDMYPVTLKGTVYEVNSGGNIGGTPTTQTTMLQNIADRANISVSNLLIVYNVGGNVMGDTIDVINRDNGQVLDTLYGFYFGENFGARRALYSATGTSQRRLDYIYTHQNSVALGSAVIAKRQVRAGRGTRLVISGTMQWIVTPENGDPAQICTARFITGPQLTWP